MAQDPPEFALSPQQRAHFVGTYGQAKGFAAPVTRFYIQDDVLHRALGNQSGVVAKPYAEDGVIVAGERIRFLMDAAGDVWAAASGEWIEPKIE